MIVSYKGIIFDFNGTLYFDSDKHEQAWRDFAAHFRQETVSQDEFYQHFHGHPARSIIEYLLGYQPDAQKLNALIQEKEEAYRKLCIDDSQTFHLSPGAEMFLDKLKSANVPMTIATALEITNISFFINHFNLTKWFDPDKIVYDDGTFPGKPSPDIYRKAADNLNRDPGELIVVEDAPSGVQAAKSAHIGMVIGIDPQGLGKLNQADRLIRDFNEFDSSLIGSLAVK